MDNVWPDPQSVSIRSLPDDLPDLTDDIPLVGAENYTRATKELNVSFSVSYRFYRLPVMLTMTINLADKIQLCDVRKMTRKKGPAPLNYLVECPEHPRPFPFPPTQFGGLTICTITDDQGNTVAAARAICSLSDTFSYRRGKQIAFGRALKSLRSLQ